MRRHDAQLRAGTKYEKHKSNLITPEPRAMHVYVFEITSIGIFLGQTNPNTSDAEVIYQKTLGSTTA